MNDWINIPDKYDNYFGFVYKITHIESGMYYIGKKTYWTIERRKYTRKPTKAERERLERYKTKNKAKYRQYKSELYQMYKGVKKTVKTKVEKDWRNYWGSSEKFKVYVEQEGHDKFKREILHNCTSAFDLSYMELLEQLKHDVLFDCNAFNEIINVRLPARKVSLLKYKPGDKK